MEVMKFIVDGIFKVISFIFEVIWDVIVFIFKTLWYILAKILLAIWVFVEPVVIFLSILIGIGVALYFAFKIFKLCLESCMSGSSDNGYTSTSRLLPRHTVIEIPPNNVTPNSTTAFVRAQRLQNSAYHSTAENPRTEIPEVNPSSEQARRPRRPKRPATDEPTIQRTTTQTHRRPPAQTVDPPVQTVHSLPQNMSPDFYNFWVRHGFFTQNHAPRNSCQTVHPPPRIVRPDLYNQVPQSDQNYTDPRMNNNRRNFNFDNHQPHPTRGKNYYKNLRRNENRRRQQYDSQEYSRQENVHGQQGPPVNNSRSHYQNRPNNQMRREYNRRADNQRHMNFYSQQNQPNSVQTPPTVAQPDPPVTQPKVKSDECVICMDERRTYLILPCAHLCICDSCIDRFRHSDVGQNCPVCRGEIKSVMRVYD